MKVKIKQSKESSDLPLPSYGHAGDAGLDLRAAKETVLKPQQRAAIPTGTSIAIPSGYVGLIWDKSGLAFKHGITTLGGVIDATYRGEIHVCMYNTSDEVHTFKRGEKVAQLLVQPIENISLEVVEELDGTDRGADGFGSTGRV